MSEPTDFIIAQPPTKAEIEKAFEGTNFGPNAKPEIILKNGLLAISCGYALGSTLCAILEELGLIGRKSEGRPSSGNYTFYVTELGRRTCYDWSKVPDSAVVIDHVKWHRCTGDPEFYPSADTERFKELVGTNRGKLIFIPAKEDYGPTRE